MAVLTAERVIPRKGAESTATPPTITLLAKANAIGFKGGLVGVDATGFAVSGASLSATAIKIVGVLTKSFNNTGGANGAISVDARMGVFPFVNLGGDPIVQATMLAGVFCEDDQTVRLTSNTSTRSPVGIFVGFDEAGLPLVRVGNFSQTGV